MGSSCPPVVKPWPLHWEHGVLATGPPGKSPNFHQKQPILQTYLSADFPAHLEGRASLSFHSLPFPPEHRPKGLCAAETQLSGYRYHERLLWPTSGPLVKSGVTQNSFRWTPNKSWTSPGQQTPSHPLSHSAFPGPWITFTWSNEGKQSVSRLFV